MASLGLGSTRGLREAEGWLHCWRRLGLEIDQQRLGFVLGGGAVDAYELKLGHTQRALAEIVEGRIFVSPVGCASVFTWPQSSPHLSHTLQSSYMHCTLPCPHHMLLLLQGDLPQASRRVV